MAKTGKHLYSNGYVIEYPEGDISKEREKLVYLEDTEDRIYTIKDGDKLTLLANRFYGDPLKWYIIADINNIDNPFVLTSGQNIIIPGIKKYEI